MRLVLACTSFLVLTACVSGPVGVTPMSTSAPTGASPVALTAQTTRTVTVPTDGFETYVTQHNGFTRVRRSNTQAGDDLILAQFEDANPASPAGYRSMVDNQNAGPRGRVNVEVIGAQASPTVGISRILRLTTDVEGANLAQLARAGGTITLLGEDHMFLGTGSTSEGYAAGRTSGDNSLYLGLNFDNQTAALHIIHDFGRTTSRWSAESDVVDLLGEDLAFNPTTGFFGGEITGSGTYTLSGVGQLNVRLTGSVLGAVGGSAADDLVAGGIFEARGDVAYIGALRTQGVFWASN